ncbi:hypothetical protein D5086_022805 [Populus alba]|uniref:Uncharacterized protein n=1 Tax=Populus alba TaxID=43335 RepID=A0ACC4B9J8_POPAL
MCLLFAIERKNLKKKIMGFAVASMVVFVQIFPLDELVAMEVEGFDSGFSFTALFGSATTLVHIDEKME